MILLVHDCANRHKVHNYSALEEKGISLSEGMKKFPCTGSFLTEPILNLMLWVQKPLIPLQVEEKWKIANIGFVATGGDCIGVLIDESACII